VIFFEPNNLTIEEQLQETKDELEESKDTIEELNSEKKSLLQALLILCEQMECGEEEIASLLSGDSSSFVQRFNGPSQESMRPLLEREIQKKREAISLLEAQLDEKDMQIAKNSGEKEILKKDLIFINEENAKLKQRVMDMSLKFQNLKEWSMEKIVGSRGTVSDQLVEVQAPLEAKIKSLERQLGESRASISEKIESETMPLKFKLNIFEKQINAFKEEVELKDLALKKLTLERESLSEELTRVYDSKCTVIAEPLKKKIVLLNVHLDDERSVIENKQKIIEQLNVQQKATSQELKEVLGKIGFYEGQLEELRKKYKKSQADISGEIKKAKKPLEKELQVHIKQLKDSEHLVKEKDALTKKLRKKYDSVEKDLLAIRKENRALRRELNDLTKKYGQAQGALKSKANMKQERVTVFERQRKDEMTYLDALKQEVQNALDLINVKEQW